MKVMLVYGCPCSGKSTYVAAHASSSDMIYDYDALLSATTTQKQHLTERHAAHFVLLELRSAFVDAASKESAIECLWLQCRWPTDTIRGILKGVDTEDIFIEATKDECYERLMSDESRPDKDEWKAVIDAWFDEHGDSAGKENNRMSKFWRWKNHIRNEAESGEQVNSRTLYLNGPIAEDSWFGDEVTPGEFRSELESGDGDITVWINSPGGDCFAAASIYNMLREYKGKVTVKIDAIAASAASVIAMAGDMVYVSPVSMIMIHNPATIAMGDHNDMQKAIDVLNEVKASIINAYHDKTGLSKAKLAQLMEDETWMNAKKAVELGFADKIAYSDDKESEEDPDKKEKEPVEDSMMFGKGSYVRQVTNKVNAKYHVEPEPDIEKPVEVTSLYARLNALKQKF